MNLIFKNKKIGNNHSYLYVSGHRCDNTIECADEFSQLYLKHEITGNITFKNKLLFYLDLAGFLTAELDRCVILNYTPVSEFQNSFQEFHFIRWKYEILSDDQMGMGADRGFVRVGKHVSGQHQRQTFVLAPVKNLDLITSLPEDLFSDDSTNVTIFGLHKGRLGNLLDFLNADTKPQIEDFLQTGELFIHLMCAKEYGHFNLFLIKAKHDLHGDIAAYQNVLDADN